MPHVRHPLAVADLGAVIASRPFRGKDFAETSTGQCRIMPSLARQLAPTTSTWAGEVAPHAELVAKLLAADAGLGAPPTLLTGHTRREARPAGSRKRPQKALKPVVPAQVCSDCGWEIPAGQRRCPDCHATANTTRLRDHQAASTLARQTTGKHPSARAEVRARIAAAQRAQWEARRLDIGTGYTGRSSEFRRLILPHLAGATPARLADATGLSRGYCAQIRDGRRVPHVRHWAALQLAGLRSPSRDTAPEARGRVLVVGEAQLADECGVLGQMVATTGDVVDLDRERAAAVGHEVQPQAQSRDDAMVEP